MIEYDGLKVILHTLETTVNLPDKELCHSLKACVLGLLLNLIMGQNDLYPEVRNSLILPKPFSCRVLYIVENTIFLLFDSRDISTYISPITDTKDKQPESFLVKIFPFFLGFNMPKNTDL